MSKLHYKGATILITGASAGIGREMARLLSLEAKALIIVARRKERLDELATELRELNPHLQVLAISCDLNELSSLDQLLAQIDETIGPVDILINNAGMGDASFFEQSSWTKLSQMFQTNMIAPAYLAHKLLPSMLKRNVGGILNVSSLAGHFNFPGLTSYNGSKFFLTGFTEGLRIEAAGSRVIISQLCPGPVKTEFAHIAAENIKARTPSWMEISAQQCAEEALRGFSKGRAVIIPGWPIRWLVSLYKIFPSCLRRELMGLLGQWMRRSPSFEVRAVGQATPD